MLLVKLKPTTPGNRGKIKIYNNLYKGGAVPHLCKKIIKKTGRDNLGHITVRHKGGGVKKIYRIVDFNRLKDNIYAKVIRFEYDPNRNANLALLLYEDGEKRYIIEPYNLSIGDKVISGNNVLFNIGNSTYLKNIPYGSKVHCIELKPGKGGQFIRSAGCYAIVISKDPPYVYLSLKSGELRRFNEYCRATIGQVGNIEYNLLNLGKAGVNRLKGVRPTVRGVAMNPVDHPHGGGEGRTSGGRDPVTPWGIYTKGYKTVKKKNFNIIKRR